jgi:hypothetical protein
MHRSAFVLTMTCGLAVAAAAADKTTTFHVRIENVSTGMTLRSSNGDTAPASNSPGLWIVHTGQRVVFTSGKRDRGMGLEAQAEDGNPSRLAASVKKMKGVRASGVFDTPVGDDKPGPALPGKAYEFTFEAKPGERLSVTTMFGQSNDLFYAPSPDGMALFQDGAPISGDVTGRFHLWDAGTEVNEEPGFGPNQAPRQAAPNTGASEHEPVRRIEEVKDGFTYPPVEQVLRVTITPRAGAMMTSDAQPRR